MTVWWILGIILLVCFGLVVFIGAPYVPSRRRDLRVAFDELYPLSSQDVVVDIGSGDGVVLRQAAMRGARAVGYEINPFLVALSRCLSRGNKKVTVRCVDFWRTALPPDTTVVYTFGDSRDIARMAQKVQDETTRLQKTIHFVSLGFAVPGRKIDRKVEPFFLYKIEPLQAREP